MSFRITGLSPEPFRPLFALDDGELALQGARRCIVDEAPGYPDRVSLRDVPVGETVILVNHVSQDAPTPFRASHAIYVWQGANEARDLLSEIPEAMRNRLLSLRSFDADGMMVDAEISEGRDAAQVIDALFEPSGVSYIHAHYAKRGCYAARIDRA